MVNPSMSKSYSKKNLKEYINEAKTFLESEKIPGFEKYLEAIYNENPVFGHLDSVLFIADLRLNKIVYVSSNAKDIEGYEADELTRLSATEYMEMMHPNDSDMVVNRVFVDGMSFTADHPEIPFDKFKVSFNYRLKQKDGTYKMLMQQFSYMMVDKDNNPLMLMGTVSDISDFYNKNEIFCRIIKQNHKGKWEKVFERFYKTEDDVHQDIPLSPKEIELIRFIEKGLTSKEIAHLTNRSIETVNSQRKNILKKIRCKSMTEAVVMAKNKGWIN